MSINVNAKELMRSVDHNVIIVNLEIKNIFQIDSIDRSVSKLLQK
ncbi:22296_t:CDS:1, partial [Gigaspora rosea]